MCRDHEFGIAARPAQGKPGAIDPQIERGRLVVIGDRVVDDRHTSVDHLRHAAGAQQWTPAGNSARRARWGQFNLERQFGVQLVWNGALRPEIRQVQIAADIGAFHRLQFDIGRKNAVGGRNRYSVNAVGCLDLGQQDFVAPLECCGHLRPPLQGF